MVAYLNQKRGASLPGPPFVNSLPPDHTGFTGCGEHTVTTAMNRTNAIVLSVGRYINGIINVNGVGHIVLTVPEPLFMSVAVAGIEKASTVSNASAAIIIFFMTFSSLKKFLLHTIHLEPALLSTGWILLEVRVISLQNGQHVTKVRLGCGVITLGSIGSELRDNSGQNTDNGDDDHQLNEGKTLLVELFSDFCKH
jgi:hypothetical protein